MKKELISFPFRPYLAKFLFYSLNNEIVEHQDLMYRQLDIDLRSVDGFYIRMLLTASNGQKIKVKEGFKLTIAVPRVSAEYPKFIQDSRNKSLIMSEQAAKKLEAYFVTRFFDHFTSFVSGWVNGSGSQRGSIKAAVRHFMDTYHLLDADGLSEDALLKFYDRTNCPMKVSIYNKHKGSILENQDLIEGKSMITRYTKK